MAEIRVGTCSWTDRTLLESITFYPPGLKSAEDRLKFYTQHFDTVEVARRSHKTFIMFNNCYQDYAIRNAGQLARMVRDLEHY